MRAIDTHLMLELLWVSAVHRDGRPVDVLQARQRYGEDHVSSTRNIWIASRGKGQMRL